VASLIEMVFEKNGDISLMEVTMASTQSANEASMLFDWLNVESFVQHMILYPPSTMCPFNLATHFTVKTFKAALPNCFAGAYPVVVL
jgi:hypothetical protein